MNGFNFFILLAAIFLKEILKPILFLSSKESGFPVGGKTYGGTTFVYLVQLPVFHGLLLAYSVMKAAAVRFTSLLAAGAQCVHRGQRVGGPVLTAFLHSSF